MKLINKSRRTKRGAALVEYGLIVAGVALVAAVAISVFGSKTAGMIAASAKVIPGTNANDNGNIGVGHMIQVDNNGGTITANQAAIDAGRTTGDSLGVDASSWVIEPTPAGN